MLDYVLPISFYILSILFSSFVIRVLKISTRPEEGKIAGVCAGMSQASDMPVWWVRTFFLVFIIFAGYGIVLYLTLWLFMSFPKR